LIHHRSAHFTQLLTGLRYARAVTSFARVCVRAWCWLTLSMVQRCQPGTTGMASAWEATLS
jgi:hypothetical protein